MDKDTLAKRAAFIRETTEIRETFSFASPVEILRAVKLYAGSHYGSNLWQLDSGSACQYYAVGLAGAKASSYLLRGPPLVM